jgi:hypothetical protein
MSTCLKLLRLAIAASLLVSTLLFVVWSIHWPLVGDASLIHYIGFVIAHGRAPYRDLGDMNMPGSYLIEMAVMKTFGGGALAWRIFDFSLLAIAAGAYSVVTRRGGGFAAIFPACLFALIHGRDGLAQGGQRDLTMAVLLVAATAVLFLAVERRAWWGVVAFGLIAGVAFTIKPTALPLSLSQLAIAMWVMRRPRPMSQKRDMGHPVLHPVWTLFWAAVGMVAGPLLALAFLIQQGSLRAFWIGLHTIVPFYESLGHRPLGYLLQHSVSPLMALVILWFAVLALARPQLDWRRGMLLCGVAFGLVSYLVQARGWPYYRYPLLAFLLPLMALDFTSAMSLFEGRLFRTRVAAVLALAALCAGGFWLGPQSAVIVHRIRWRQTDLISSLEENLNRLGGPALSGHVQCIDWFSGCGTTLYKMHLLPATGVLADFLLFGPASEPAVQQSRAQFNEAFTHPPRVIIVTSYLQPSGPDRYKKLALWPELQTFLTSRYRLDTDWTPIRTERWWSRDEFPAGYRLYVLKQ